MSNDVCSTCGSEGGVHFARCAKHPTNIAVGLRQLNRQRKNDGLPPLTLEEYTGQEPIAVDYSASDMSKEYNPLEEKIFQEGDSVVQNLLKTKGPAATRALLKTNINAEIRIDLESAIAILKSTLEQVYGPIREINFRGKQVIIKVGTDEKAE